MDSRDFDPETVNRLRQVAAEDAAAAHGHNQASQPGVKERVRRAIRTPLGRIAVVAGGALLAAGAALGLAQNDSHGGEHGATHRPAAIAEHPHHAVAAKPNTALLDKEKARFQAASLATARTIVKDIAQSPIGAPYKQVYVGVYPGQA